MATTPKNQRSKRTSIWLDNSLRKQLDAKASAEGRSLAGTIEFYLRKGLGVKTAPALKSSSEAEAETGAKHGTVFG